MEIKRRLPDTVVITATPAVETYTVESAAGWAVLSQSYRCCVWMPRRPRGLCASTARRPIGARAGPAGEIYRGGQAVRSCRPCFQGAGRGLGPISEVDLTNTLELSFLYQDRIRIVLGTANDLDYKIKWAWKW